MKFVYEGSQVTLWLEGLERVWALKHRLQIPHYAIAEINYVPEVPVMQDFEGHLRLPGSAIPWLFAAGTFTKGDEREFWYVRLKQPGIMTIELKPDTLNYDRIRVSCAEETAVTLTAWWRAKTPTRL